MANRITNRTIQEPILESICVGASCVGKLGAVEYRGIYTGTHEVIFHKRPMPNGTQTLGEFLAIVHALAHLKKQSSNIPIYSASNIAISWVKHRNFHASLIANDENKEIFNLLKRASKWLDNNDYTNTILNWNTQAWGRIPAYFTPNQNLQNTSLPTPNSPQNTVRITISGNTYPVRELLSKKGLTWKNQTWIADIVMTEIEPLKEFCRQNDLQYKIVGKDFKETRLARGYRPLPTSHTSAIMGEGRLQWEIEEMRAIERLRHRKRRVKK